MNPEKSTSRAQPAIVIALCLTALTAALFCRVGGFAFNNYDDPFYVSENPIVARGMTWEGTKWALTTSYFDFWHPLTWLSHMLDWQLFGAKPGLHHLTNVWLHAANTLLLFVFLRRATGALWRSAFVAAVFAFHPLRVESVAWVAERKDVLSTFFWVASLWAYVRYVQAAGSKSSRKSVFFVFSLALFALGLMAKPMLVTLPCVLFLLDYWPLNRWREALTPAKPSLSACLRTFKPLFIEKIHYFVLSVASSIITYAGMNAGNNVLSSEKLSWGIRLANIPVSYARYLGKMIWPSDLAVLYPISDRWTTLQVSGAVALLIVITLLALWRARSAPYFIVGWLLFVGIVVPTTGIVSMGFQAMADRYVYVPSIGIAIIIAWGVTALTARWPNRDMLLGTVSTLVLAAFAMGTWRQLAHWQNSITVWEQTLRATKNNLIAEYNLGDALLDAGKPVEAARHYREALRIQPDHLDANLNLGLALGQSGELREATNYFAQALRVKPDYYNAYVNMAITLAKLKESAGAAAHYAQALQVNSNSPSSHYGRGRALMELSDFSQAAIHFEQAARLDPASAGVRFQLGLALASQRQFPEAIKQYRESLRLRSDSPETLDKLAWLLATHPQSALRNGAEAVQMAERACTLSTNRQPAFITTLAAAYAETGQFDKAKATAQTAAALANSLGQTNLAGKNQTMLLAFEARQPHRE